MVRALLDRTIYYWTELYNTIFNALILKIALKKYTVVRFCSLDTFITLCTQDFEIFNVQHKALHYTC